MNLFALSDLRSIRVKFQLKGHAVKVNYKYIDLICPMCACIPLTVDGKIKGIQAKLKGKWSNYMNLYFLIILNDFVICITGMM